jgi:methionyl-tRNA formyltransferase
LFSLGVEGLAARLPEYFTGNAALVPQIESLRTLAPKISTEDAELKMTDSIELLHNKVRAFAGWPGARASVQIGSNKVTILKILETKKIDRNFNLKELEKKGESNVFIRKGNSIFWPYRSPEMVMLELLKVQLPGKRIMSTADFCNGLRDEAMILAEK